MSFFLFAIFRDARSVRLIRSEFYFSGNDQEIEFQEIEIHVFHEIKTFAKLIRRLSPRIL